MSVLERVARGFSGPFMLVAGANHFITPRTYEKIMPDYLPAHRELVYASGVAELFGGALTLHPRSRRAGGLVLSATLLGIAPAHIHMLQHRERYEAIPPAVLWARLPVQVGMIYLVWVATLRGSRSS